MGYTITERELAARFRGGMTEGVIPGLGVTLTGDRFRSSFDCSFPDGKNVSEMFRFLFRSREAEEYNREFTYYIIKPTGGVIGHSMGAVHPSEATRSASCVNSSPSLVNSSPSAPNRIPSGVNRIPSGVNSNPSGVTLGNTAVTHRNVRGTGEQSDAPGSGCNRGAIILLHGLNERSWNKYIQWGAALASGTGRPVVLFPHAWHMNRSPRSWIDRHLMMPLVAARTSLQPDTRLSTFVNVALSTRMNISPQRFMLSGYQTVKDLSEFIGLVREGNVPGIAAGGPVDLFAYSIGALAAQVMMLSGPSPLPADSRVMLFCGGSAFSMMNGTSKLIMDSRAFEMLLAFYLGWPAGGGSRDRDRFAGLMNDTPEGEAFYAMTSLQRLKALRGRPFSKWEGRLKAVSLAGDQVIPPDAVREALSGADHQIWDTEYPCSHESPFPVLAGEKADKVDRTFDRLFTTAAGFLS